MTVSATNASSGPFTGNGSTTAFPFTFSAGSASEVQVLVNGAVQSSGYGVALNVDSFGSPTGGGTVTFDTAPATGASILLQLNPDFDQNLALQNNGAFLAKSIEGAFDEAARRDIYLKTLVESIPQIQIAQQVMAAITAAAQALSSQHTADNAAATTTAQSLASALYASAAQAAASGNLFDTTAHALSNGVINTTSLVGGTGGTNGTFAVAFSGGGGSGAAATFVVAGGAVTQITITSKGVGYTSAPTISFAASTGLSGASATAVIGPRTSSGDYFLVIGAGNSYAELYKNVAGVATDQSLAIPSLAAVTALSPLAATVTTASGDVTDADHALSIVDADGRIELAIAPDGQLAGSHFLANSIANINAVDNTPAAYSKAARHGISFTYTDWWGVTIGGQSNASGNSLQVVTTTQPFNNKKLSGGSLVALVEPSAPVGGTSESVASGATAHAKDALLRVMPPWATFNQDWIATNMGAGGTALTGIAQGTTPYNGGKTAITSIKALATSAGKTYAERALLFLHGESDSNISTSQATYYSGLIALKNNWNTDILAITGQTDRIPMFIEQVSLSDTFDTTVGPALAMLQAAEADPEVFIIAPGYAFRFINDGLHLNGHDMRRMGEYFGKALHRYYVERKNPGTVRPLTWTRVDSRTIDVTFYVPVPPLVFDLDQIWPGDAGMGFAVYNGASEIAIRGARITSPTTVRITTSADIAAGYTVTYATKVYTRSATGGLGSGNRRGPRGNLRDSDQTASYYTDAFGNSYPLHNWCAIFQKTLA